jgi:hypothetical protein
MVAVWVQKSSLHFELLLLGIYSSAPDFSLDCGVVGLADFVSGWAKSQFFVWFSILLLIWSNADEFIQKMTSPMLGFSRTTFQDWASPEWHQDTALTHRVAPAQQ